MKATLLLALLVAAQPLCAAPLDARRARQDGRIVAGVVRGDLTPCEAIRLEHRTDRIAARETAYRGDGRLGPRERRDLHRRLDRSSADIAEQRRDGRGCF